MCHTIRIDFAGEERQLTAPLGARMALPGWEVAGVRAEIEWRGVGAERWDGGRAGPGRSRLIPLKGAFLHVMARKNFRGFGVL